jgi:hypothetical protein
MIINVDKKSIWKEVVMTYPIIHLEGAKKKTERETLQSGRSLAQMQFTLNTSQIQAQRIVIPVYLESFSYQNIK